MGMRLLPYIDLNDYEEPPTRYPSEGRCPGSHPSTGKPRPGAAGDRTMSSCRWLKSERRKCPSSTAMNAWTGPACHRWGYYGENLGAKVSAEKQVTSWMSSDGHRANILREGYHRIGVGCYLAENGKRYWIQVFSK